jgi:hypothetical protein
MPITDERIHASGLQAGQESYEHSCSREDSCTARLTLCRCTCFLGTCPRHDLTAYYLKNFFWGMRFSDPYQGYIYNKLHRGNLGTFGAHLWPLAKQVLIAVSESVRKVGRGKREP